MDSTTEVGVKANSPSEDQAAVLARAIVTTLNEVPDHAISYIDDNVSASLPPGSHVDSFWGDGATYWTRHAVIKAVLSNGSYAKYFMKVTHTPIGRGNIQGEYESMKAIHGLMPDFAPEPVNFGKYASNPEICFFIMKFVDMTDEIPEADSLPEKVAEMHRKGISPNGTYGFHVPVNQGALQQPNTWTISWEKFFTEMVTRCFNWELQIHGEDKEMQELFKNMVEKVIPRLLRPLETGDNDIKPRLVHGNLWDGNARSNIMTDKPIIYDASSMYAHNEFELGPWNLPRYQIFRPYIREYQRHFERSEPKEDFEDRLILYRYRHTITSSAAYLNNLRYRETAIRDMRYLVEKYPNGYEGEHGRKGD